MTLHYNFVQNKTAFIIIPFNSPVDTAEAVNKAYKAVVDKLQQDNLLIVHERIFGSLAVMEEVLKIRREIFASADITESGPVSYLEGTPPWGEGIAGINIQAINPDKTDNGITTIYNAGLPTGKTWSWDGDKYLILQNMTGNHDTSPGIQTADAIQTTLRLLEDNEMNFKNVSRTWFYLADILEWYDEFNLVRNNLYKKFAMMPSPEHRDLLLPASTGIDCHNSENNALMLNLLAIDTKAETPLKITQLSNQGQQDAFCYGSAFSRGAIIANKKDTWIQLSGTASIDETGATVHLYDIEKQINCTLDKISTLLAQENTSIKDLCAISVFVQKAEYITIYHKIIKERGLENIPAVCMVADVCRGDLLFEIDAEGVIDSCI
jgi:enamine deaminase RidA (YjgF/YER057c/UK114 family)